MPTTPGPTLSSREKNWEGGRCTPKSRAPNADTSARQLGEGPSPARSVAPWNGGDKSDAGGRVAPLGACHTTIRGGELYPSLAAARSGCEVGLLGLLRAAEATLVACIAPRLAGGWCESWTPDVVQDALVDVARSYRDCRASSEAQVHAWLVAIARRQVATLFRREHERQHVPLDFAPDFPVAPPAPPSSRIAPALDSLRIALAGLEEDHLRLLWTRWVASGTWSEVGEALGTTAGGAKRRWQSLLPKLRAAIQAPGDGIPVSARRRVPPH